ncbi:Heterokaryon incompatibility protein [Hyphodiscus hymeniophilus]|uniref:Heterokaryon incompatibility protein n=1 Tax=Hyphodiscus hymeniophilus TaxID=353542 RepID=A0A9P6VH19_9HELO|nr:Heterokaryon incompatibility protein [Hyphodiscus hymeniophilus]
MASSHPLGPSDDRDGASRKRRRLQYGSRSQHQLDDGTSSDLQASLLARKRIDSLRNTIQEDLRNFRDTYVYNSLRADKEQIRILVIEPGKGDDPIKCRLFPGALPNTRDKAGKEPFTALSYFWGEGDPIHEITITSYKTATERLGREEELWQKTFGEHAAGWSESGTIHVRANLYVALKRFRHKEKCVNTWIDALCINQRDLKERSAQVKQMHQLYTYADKVSVWLGDGSGKHAPQPGACFEFLREILDLNPWDTPLDDRMTNAQHQSDLSEDARNIVDLMCNKWFSRRWIIQELALARTADVVYGDEEMLWSDFADAIAIFIRSQDQILPAYSRMLSERASSFAELALTDGWKRLGANALVDFINNLFRRNEAGDIQHRMMTLEGLVSNLLAFEATDPKDTIYAVLSLAKDTYDLSDFDRRLLPDYEKKCLRDVYTDFIHYCVDRSQSLDILMRHWAPFPKLVRDWAPSKSKFNRKESSQSSLLAVAKEMEKLRQEKPLPSWVPSIDHSSHGPPARARRGRSNGDSFVGNSFRTNHKNYSATLELKPDIEFGPRGVDVQAVGAKEYDGLLFVKGLQIGKIKKTTPRSSHGMIFKEAFEIAGFDRECWEENEWWAENVSRVPDAFWRTIVADRGPDGANSPSWYARACIKCLENLRDNGDLRPDDVLDLPKTPSIAKDFMNRVKDVVWERKFVLVDLADQKKTYGLVPARTEENDIVCVLFGCSVPAILRQKEKDGATYFEMVGECFIYGMMDGEAVSGKSWEHPYNDAQCFELH